MKSLRDHVALFPSPNGNIIRGNEVVDQRLGLSTYLQAPERQRKLAKSIPSLEIYSLQ